MTHFHSLSLGPLCRPLFLPIKDRAGMGRDFVPGYPSPYYPRVLVTLAFWACTQLENIHLNENNK